MKRKKVFRALISSLVCLSMIMSYLPMAIFNAAAETVDSRKVDLSTMDDWKNFFGENVLNTENAGGVWTDKSVFKDASAFNNPNDENPDYVINMDDPDNNFLVALSAIASNKSITGYSAIPTDTMLVLDLSNSMSDAALRNMVTAANDAIRKLQNLNYNNRIGVVLYAGTRVRNNVNVYGLENSATTILPLGRYTGVGTAGRENFIQFNDGRVSVIRGVIDNSNRQPGKNAEGATYIQAGVQLALNEFLSVAEGDTVIQSGPQKGTVRMPVMVLMSDGAPTAATTSYTNVGNSTHGTGGSATNENAFLTQLTNAWAKAKMTEKYSKSALFYTLGLNVGGNDYAESVLDPLNSTNTINGWWETYLNVKNEGSVNLGDFSVNRKLAITDKLYVDEYFSASNDSGLIAAFDRIVNQIIIQSRYYPTLVQDGAHNLDGYITVDDELGEYMEVKGIKGITVDGKLYEGYKIVESIFSGEYGNVSGGDLSGINDEGVEFLKAVEKRLGCTEEQAKTVVEQAIKNGQLSYKSTTEFSNYIGWYADSNGAFLGFWDGSKEYNNKPANATSANKSYGFLGTVGSAAEYNLTDMLYISVQVHKDIASGHEAVLYKIPASLVPMVNYEIKFNGTELETGTDFQLKIGGADEPIRLIFEIGLRSDINRINVNDKIDPRYVHKDSNGYLFYSNAWAEHEHSESSLPTTHDSTVMDFQPSLENERYYYTIDTPIVDANGNDVTSAPVAGQVYYHYVTIFSATSGDMANKDSEGFSVATKSDVLVQVSEKTISDPSAIGYDPQTGTYYVKKGTIFRYLAEYTGTEYAKEKADKTLTNSLDYSNFPAVVLPTGEIDYHITACLGNNGVLRLTPAQGIKITKEVEYPELSSGVNFRFKVTLEGDGIATSYPVYNDKAELLYTVNVNGGVFELEIPAGETVYIADIDNGIEYTIEELPTAGWSQVGVSGSSGTVADYTFGEAVFKNTPNIHGTLIINKTVVHPFGSGYNMPKKDFDITVEFKDENGDPLADGTTLKVNDTDTVVTGGRLEFSIGHNETIVIGEIPDETSYKITEKTYSGFTLSGTNLEGKITTDYNVEALLTNTYSPAAAQFDITHIGYKYLEGREWIEGDKFDFELQYFNGIEWETIAVDGTTDKTAAFGEEKKEFSFTELIKGFSFDHIGTYQFRVREIIGEIGGMSYDVAEKKFEVVVTDDNLSGKLIVSEVTTTTPKATSSNSGTVITNNGGSYKVETHFNNAYAALGTTTVSVDIEKKINNETGVDFSKAGFTFEIFRAEGSGEVSEGITNETDSAGLTSFPLNYGTDSIGKTYNYKVVEVDDGKEGVKYDKTVHAFSVTIVDNLDGTISAVIGSQKATEYDLSFTNTYELEKADVEIAGSKKITGKELENEKFTFELYRCSDGSFSNPVKVDDAQNVGDTFKLYDEANKAGTYYYIVKEAATDLLGFKNDTSEFKVTVEVSKGEGATLKAEVVSVIKGQTASLLEFVNTYDPDDVKATVSVVIKKNLDNETEENMGLGGFKFNLIGDNFNEFAETDENGNAEFNLTFTEENIGESFVYTLSEVDTEVDGMIYSEEKVTIEFTVLKVDNKLGVYDTADGSAVTTIQAEFTNTYKGVTPPPEEENPGTGAEDNLIPLLALLTISGGAAIVLFKKKEA